MNFMLYYVILLTYDNSTRSYWLLTVCLGKTEQVQEHPGQGGLLPVPVPVPAVQRCVLDPLSHRHPLRTRQTEEIGKM